MKLLLRWLASAAALFAVATFVPGITVTPWTTLFVAALVLGLVSALIGPVVRFLSLPIRMLTLGLFSLVINAALFGLAAWLVDGFEIETATALFVGSVAYGLATWLVQTVFGVRA
jgi:putative membrane protein